MASTSTTKIEIPGEDAWVLSRISKMISRRLAFGSDSPSQRQSLLRLLYGVQRLPVLVSDLCVSLSAGHVLFAINSEMFELISFTDDGHTAFRLQYFSAGNHCIRWHDFLAGDAKRDAIEMYLRELEEDFDESVSLSMEDYSKAGYVDEPPLESYMEYALSYEEQ